LSDDLQKSAGQKNIGGTIAAISGLLLAIAAVFNSARIGDLLNRDDVKGGSTTQQAPPTGSVENSSIPKPTPNTAQAPKANQQASVPSVAPMKPEVHEASQDASVPPPFEIDGDWSGVTDVNHLRITLHLVVGTDGRIGGVFTNWECGSGYPPLTLPLDQDSSWNGKRLVAHMTYMGKTAAISANIAGDELNGFYAEYGVDPVAIHRGSMSCATN